MKDLPRIVALYEEIDRRLDSERIDAEEEDEAHRITLKQLINEHAYFVLCWGQLEVEIDEVCRDVIRRRKSDPNWDVRRGFNFYNPEDRRLMTFDRRVAIVLDRGAGSGSPHGLVMKYYEPVVSQRYSNNFNWLSRVASGSGKGPRERMLFIGILSNIVRLRICRIS